MISPELRARILMEALPYIRAFAGKSVVIKCTGAAMEEPNLRESLVLDVILLRFVGINPVVVHGGGVQITEAMTRLGKKPYFVRGFRVTDAETMAIVEMVLVGQVNKQIVGLINQHGGKAVGLSGKDGNLILARRRPARLPTGELIDIGLVGEVETINTDLLRLLKENGFIPVIAPIGVDREGVTYNINADLVAGDLAAALTAEKVIYLTDVQGILGADGQMLSTLSRADAEQLISQGVVEGGMLPKVESSLQALKGGVAKAHIIDGHVPHAILLELFTNEGIGTEIIL